MSETGFVEGRNVSVEYRFADGQADRMTALAADLVRRRVAVIAAPGGTATVLAARSAAPNIPIVFEIGSDPVEDGLVASLNRPGGNLTGVTALNAELDAKRLGLLCELLPKALRVGVLSDPNTVLATNKRWIGELQRAAAAIGREVELLLAGNSREIESVFAGLAEKRIDALIVQGSPVLPAFRAQLATARPVRCPGDVLCPDLH